VQRQALWAIGACRTEALGAQQYRCDTCGALTRRYHSCRNRHCPKCQTLAKERWLTARRRELLPVPYFHVVFTLPHSLNALALYNPRTLYTLLFRSAAATLLEFGRNPRWLGGELSASLILHTWDQQLHTHLHVHALVSAGGLSADQHAFVRPARRNFLFPVQALSRVFRGKFLAALCPLLERGSLRLSGELSALAQTSERQRFLRALRAQPWVVYAKQPLAGPEQVLEYLARYTHRIALSNERLRRFSDGQVDLRWRDRAHGNRRKVLRLEASELIHRFLLHVLPRSFVRIRHYGLLAHRHKAEKLQTARTALAQTPLPAAPAPESAAAFVLRVAGIDLDRCPLCQHGRLHLLAIEPPAQRTRGPP
jgi:hypothetical protein